MNNLNVITKKDAIRISKEKLNELPLVEVHILHTVAGALLNRDFNNRQKALHYGGVLRARFSSQSVLHDIRFNMETEQNVHTKYMPTMIKNMLTEVETDKDLLKTELALVDQIFSTQKKKEDSEEDENTTETTEKKGSKSTAKKNPAVVKTSQIIDVDAYTLVCYVKEITVAAKNVTDKTMKMADAKDAVVKAMTDASQDRPVSDVTALFGRMSSDQTYSTIYSPLMVSHAISIDPYENDYDDFTAVDDYLLKSGIIVTDDDGKGINSGAAHMASSDISGNTYYRYCGINQAGLFQNLCIGKPFDSVDELLEKTYQLTALFIKRFILSLPTAKETRNFARTVPDAVYIDKGPAMDAISAVSIYKNVVVAKNGKSSADIGVERLKKFADDSVNGSFVDRELTGQYWMSDEYDAPQNIPAIKYKDLDMIVRP